MTTFQTNSLATRLHVSSSEYACCSSTFTEMKVRSYHNGSSSMGRIKVCKHADGSIILEDGQHRFVQRPLHHPDRAVSSTSKNEAHNVVTRFLQRLFAW